MAAVLAIPADHRYRPLALTPQRRKQRTLEVLVEQLAGLAGQRPVLAVYEDAHWIDPSTFELLGLVVQRVQRLPVLVLITFRPEFIPPWTRHAHVTGLSLSRLTRRHGSDIALRVTGGKVLPAEVLEQIVSRTDGVPLFIEELTKAVVESGLLKEEGGRFELTGPLPPRAIPTTLYDSLMARLDRFAPVKEVAQIGAVFGREFSYQLLAAVVDIPAGATRPGAGPTGRLRTGVPAGSAARSHVQLQARSGAGHGVPEPAPEQTAPAAREDRADDGGAFSRDRRGATGAAGAPLHGSGSRVTGNRLSATRGRARSSAVCLRGGDQSSEARAGGARDAAGPSGARQARAEPAAYAWIRADGDTRLCGSAGWRGLSAGARPLPGIRRGAAAALPRAAWAVSILPRSGRAARRPRDRRAASQAGGERPRFRLCSSKPTERSACRRSGWGT